MKQPILIADSDEELRQALRRRLEGAGWRVLEATRAREAETTAARGVDLAVVSEALTEDGAAELMLGLRSVDPALPVVLVAERPSVERAVAAMRAGAWHYARKPLDLDALVVEVARALASRRRPSGRGHAAADAQDLPGPEDLVGTSPPMRRLREKLSRIATCASATVLITGESGTGKDVVAHLIHGQSERAGAPFMNITCSALPDALLESELFGHERGAFTDARQQKAGLLEMADGGTVFLDEIAEMSTTLQAKLLRFLEERAFRRVGGSVDIRPDVRVVAATNRDLREGIASGTFRADLYYRLSVIHVHLPPLRERPGDVAALARHFAATFARRYERDVRGLTGAAARLLEGHPWPGNVRELRNTIERAILLSEGELLRSEDVVLPPAPQDGPGALVLPPQGLAFDALERSLVKQALRRAEGNQTRAAKLLGMSRDQIRHRIAKYHLEV